MESGYDKDSNQMKDIPKTNVMRLLENAGIPFRVKACDVSDGRLDAGTLAERIGEEPDRVFKTLVTRSGPREYFVFVIPGNASLNLKKAAKASGQKSIELIAQKELCPLTGYVHGGCSPVGQKKLFPTYIDETAQLYDYICVSGGHIGVSIAIEPEALRAFINAHFADLT